MNATTCRTHAWAMEIIAGRLADLVIRRCVLCGEWERVGPVEK